jgi:hypothetical protein
MRFLVPSNQQLFQAAKVRAAGAGTSIIFKKKSTCLSGRMMVNRQVEQQGGEPENP